MYDGTLFQVLSLPKSIHKTQGEDPMIDRRIVFEIYRLKEMLFSKRQIAQTLNLDRDTVDKYLKHPDTIYKPRQERPSKLDLYRELIKEMVTQYSKVKAPVVLRQIQDKGFDGEITIVRDYLKHLRHNSKEAFIRFESAPGQQIQIDWGHFGSLAYGDSSRKLYALAVIESKEVMIPLSEYATANEND